MKPQRECLERAARIPRAGSHHIGIVSFDDLETLAVELVAGEHLRVLGDDGVAVLRGPVDHVVHLG